MEKKLNIDNIVSIEIKNKSVTNNYYFLEEKKKLFSTRKAGFRYIYDWGSDDIYSKQQIEKSGKYIVEGNTVLMKDRVCINLVDGTNELKTFDNMSELEQFLIDNQLNSTKFIKI